MKKIIKGYLTKIHLDEVKYLYILAGVVFFCTLGLAGWFGYGYIVNHMQSIENEGAGRDMSVWNDSQEECKFRRALDGICVDSEEKINPKLVAVMIENHVDARPQSGLSQAQVVYEVLVEGGMSRFMAVYPVGDEVLKVGPVRSARTYYLDWLSEYDHAIYMHVGGSPDALEKIKQYEIFDLNEFYRGWYYWRSGDRYAPHNVYTSSKLWEGAWEQYGNDLTPDADSQTPVKSWKFEERELCVENCTHSISIPAYTVDWKFNTTTSKYERYQTRYPHTDKDGSLIEADSVIVQYVQTRVLDGVGRLGMDTVGQGKGVVFRDGYVVEGVWKKEDRENKTKWFDQEGNEISLKAGKIWIEVLNQNSEIEIGD